MLVSAASFKKNPYRSTLLIVIGFCWAFFVAFYFWKDKLYPLEVFRDVSLGAFLPDSRFLEVLPFYTHGLLVVILTLLAALALGCLLTRKVSFSQALERLVFASSLGLALISYSIFVLGALQFYRNSILWGFWIALILIIPFLWRCQLWPTIRSAYQDFVAIAKNSSPLILIFLAIFTLLGFALCLVPEIFYDALVYHLGVPRFYLNEGGIREYPVISAKYPLALQMLYLLGLALQGDLVPKLLHFSMGLFLILAMTSLAKNFRQEKAGLWAGLVIFSMPMNVLNWSSAAVDIGLALFSFLAVYAWLKSFEDNSQARTWLVLAGIFSGLAFSAKYTAVFVTAALTIVHFLRQGIFKKQSVGALKECFLIGGLAFLVAAPWLVKNYIHTGNPLFPFLNNLFETRGLDPNRLASFWAENKGFTPTTLTQYLALPWMLTFEDTRTRTSFAGPLWLAFLPLAFLMIFLSKEKGFQWLFLYCLLGLSGIWIVNRLMRYSLPFLTPLCFLLGLGYSQLDAKYKKAGHAWAFATVIMAGGLIVYILADVHLSLMPLDVILGRESRGNYISYTHRYVNPRPAAKIYQWTKQNLPPGSRLLILGDEKTAACETPFLTSGVFDIPLIVRWTRDIATQEEFYGRLKRENITHLVFNFREGLRLSGYGIFDWPEKTLAIFCDFWDKHVRLTRKEVVQEKYVKEPFSLYLFEILPEDEAREKPVYENGVLVLWENFKVPLDAPNAQNERIRLMEDLIRRWPSVSSFHSRLKLLKRLES